MAWDCRHSQSADGTGEVDGTIHRWRLTRPGEQREVRICVGHGDERANSVPDVGQSRARGAARLIAELDDPGETGLWLVTSVGGLASPSGKRFA